METLRGIVLRTVKYGDNSMIVDLFTEGRGRLSFMASTSRTKRSVRNVSFWQPLSMVEFSVELRPNGGKLPRPNEEEKENPSLYRYIESSLQWLDMVESAGAMANFHLAFLMHLSRFMGIYPNLERPDHYFDLLAGSYCDRQPPHAHFLRRQEAQALPVLFRMDYPTLHIFRFSRQERMRILQVLNEYYRLHVPNFPELKSLEVLQEFYS